MNRQRGMSQNLMLVGILVLLGVGFALLFFNEATAAVGTWMIFFTLLGVPLVMLLKNRRTRHRSDRDLR